MPIALIATLLVFLSPAAFAEEFGFWRVAAYEHQPEFPTSLRAKSPQKRVVREETGSVISGDELRERYGDGVGIGAIKLRWRGDVCIRLQKRYDRCDVAIERDQVMLFSRETKGRTPVRIQFGVRP